MYKKICKNEIANPLKERERKRERERVAKTFKLQKHQF